MKVARYDQLFDGIRAELPGHCEDPELLRACQDAMRSVCAATEIWRDKLPAIDAVAGEAEYTLAPQFDAYIKRILAVWTRTAQDVTNGKDGRLRDNSLDFTYEPATGVLEFTYDLTESVTGGIVVQPILVPTYRTEELPETLMDFLAAAVTSGAIARLCGRKGKPYFDPDMVGQHQALYLDETRRLQNLVLTGYKKQSPLLQVGWSFV